MISNFKWKDFNSRGNPDPGWLSPIFFRELRNRFWCGSGSGILNIFDPGSGIRNKHPGSTTLSKYFWFSDMRKTGVGSGSEWHQNRMSEPDADPHTDTGASSRRQITIDFIHVACDWRPRGYNLHPTGGHSGTICMQLAATRVQFCTR